MTSHDREFMNRIVNKIIEIDGGALTTYSGNYDFYEQQRALAETQQQAQFERQQAMLAKEMDFIERFKARASHAAQVQSRVKKLDKIERVEPPKRRQTVAFEFQPAPRSGDDVVKLKGVHKRYGSRSDLRGARLLGAAAGALVRDGRQRRRQVDAAQARGRRRRARRRRRGGGRQRQARLLRPARHGPARRRAHRLPDAGGGVPAGRPGLAAGARRLLRLLRRRRREALPRAVRRREGAAGHGADALRPAELPGARRADQPPRHGAPRRC